MSQPLPFVIGPYKVVQELGRGKHTVVYKAQQTNLGNRDVALKILHRHDAETWQKFQAEVKLSASLNSPGVRRIYDAGQTLNGHPYIVMEYVDYSLKDWIRKRYASKQHFSRAEVLRLLTPVAHALDAIHQRGLVHLDVKPDNILVSREGQAMLADFGISRPRDTITHAGTPRYMSPEQAAGNRPVGPWSDIYSLAVVMYEMLTARAPFQSDIEMVLLRQHLEEPPPAPRQFNREIDRALEQMLLAALSKDYQQRPHSANTLLQALQGGKKSMPIWIPGAVVMVIVGLLGTLWFTNFGPLEWGKATPTVPPKSPTVTYTPTPVPATPTATVPPTSTPAPTPTVVILTVPYLIAPANSSTVQTALVSFRWAAAGRQDWIARAYHTESQVTVMCEKTATFCQVALPTEHRGEWVWWVEDTSGTVKSVEWHFTFAPDASTTP